MRLFQAIAGSRHGGAEAFFERLAGAFARAGIAQRLAIRRDSGRAARLRAQGLEPIELPFGGLLDLRTRPALAAAIAEFRPDVVLTWMSRASRLCPRGDFVRVGRLGGYYDLKHYRACDHLIANTRDIAAWIADEGWPAERVHYLPNFVDAASAPAVARETLMTPAGVPLLLALGRLHRNKAFDVLLAALAEVPGAFLWLAGEGGEERALKTLAGRLGVAPRVRFLGWRADVPALLAAADLLVCPSRHEPLGNVVIEGWAQARPVVATASQGPGALIRDGETGILVPVDDAAALAGAIRRVLADPALARALAGAGRAAFETEFTEGAVVAAYRALFERLAAERAG
ncbi:MAG: glycosyltransferase [Proteobacteria bacterium]|nr:glycosyltransferase [Pseudomonadota bacterium]